MPGDIGQSFLADMKQGCSVGRRQGDHQIFAAKLAWAQVEDIRTDITNSVIQSLNSLLDLQAGHPGIFLNRALSIVQSQANGINRLDDPIVQVHANPLALFQDSEPLSLAVQASVLN